MGNKDRRIIIELLGFEKGMNSLREYIFNLLNYFYANRDTINYERIIIWCKDTSKEMFIYFEDKFEVVGFPCSSRFKKLWLQTILPLKYDLNKYDLLFSPGNYSGIIKCGTELLVIHDLLFKRKNWVPSRAMRWQREVMVPISIKKADCIIAISHFTKHDIENYYPYAKGKIKVVYNPFSFEKYESEGRANIGEEYFIVISSNYDYKNQKTIFIAFQKYCEKGGNKKLVVVGNINEKAEGTIIFNNLPQEIKSRIIWKQNISNESLGALYKDASCLISASKFEGLGMPPAEAMSFGLPVLLSDIPPHREVSMNMGEYFDATDADSLANKMLKMEFKKYNYSEKVKSMFADKETSAKYIEIINTLYYNS